MKSEERPALSLFSQIAALHVVAWEALGASPRYGVAGRLVEDSLHPVSEPAPVGGRVGDAVGHREPRVEVRHDLGRVLGSDDAPETSPVGKMRPRPIDPSHQASIKCVTR